jgi:hypothetical protein
VHRADSRHGSSCQRQNEKGPKNAPMRLSDQFRQRGCQTVTKIPAGRNQITGGLSRLNGRAPAEREYEPGGESTPIHHHVTGPETGVRTEVSLVAQTLDLPSVPTPTHSPPGRTTTTTVKIKPSPPRGARTQARPRPGFPRRRQHPLPAGPVKGGPCGTVAPRSLRDPGQTPSDRRPRLDRGQTGGPNTPSTPNQPTLARKQRCR